MAKAWCKFEQNWTKAIKVIDLNTLNVDGKYVLPVTIQLIVRITKWHNSCNTDPSAPIFLPNVHCLMVKVWCIFEQNLKKAIKLI